MLVLDPQNITLSQLRAVYGGEGVSLHQKQVTIIEKGHALLMQKASGEAAIYGVNTGFGKLANIRIPQEKLKALQINIVRSHCAGVGDPLPHPIVRLVMVLKVISLSQGASGVALETVELLLSLLKQDIIPYIPAQGSVGASGDLAPLAHLAAVLIGEGEAYYKGELLNGGEALQRVGLKPLTLKPKEGLALLNGTQVSTALALAGLFAFEECFFASLLTGALSTDAIAGSDTPFHPTIHTLRRHQGQIKIAHCLRVLMENSDIRRSHLEHDERVQDPYSIRCQPQIMGAALEIIENVSTTLLNEAMAVTDNPLLDLETGEMLSGGNFHAEPVAFAADMLAMVIAEVGNLVQRRCAMLVDPVLTGLPAFLTKEAGLNSGFMIAEVTSAALASENRQKAALGSIDTIPTSANQEDHVSMATHTARRLLPMCDNLNAIIAIEALMAAQGIDFRSPLNTSPLLQAFHNGIRQVSPPLQEDRNISKDIRDVSVILKNKQFLAQLREKLPSLLM
jgi:histidine ammonia-lyase